MASGIDCTAALTTTTGKRLLDLGYSFVCRYLVPESMSWKRITIEEAKAITEANLKIVCVYEYTGTRAKRGATAGQADGTAAYNEAKLIGQTEGTAIYFAVDYDAPTGDFDEIEAYLKAASSQIPGYSVGVYGSYSVCEAMAARNVCRHFWQTYAWSDGKLSKHANIYQYKNGVMVAGINSDLNKSFGGEGWWNLSDMKVVDYNGEIKVEADVLNVRAETNTSSNIITQVTKGNVLTAIGITSDNAWYKVKINDSYGYVSAKYVSKDEDPELPFKDFNKVSGYAKDSVKRAKDLGLMLGDSNGNFNPAVPATRQDLAVVAIRLYELFKS